MAAKRAFPGDNEPVVCATRQESKRSRFSPPTEAESHSSARTTTSQSDGSTRCGGEEESEETDQSSLDSTVEDDDSDESSDVSSSSLEESEDEETDEEDVAEEIVTVGAPKKPIIDPQRILSEANELQNRLQTILPQIQAANMELSKGITTLRTLEDIEDGEEYIEMNLGLGVWEEKREREDTNSEEEEMGEPDAMHELMGGRQDHKQGGIVEVVDSTSANERENDGHSSPNDVR